MDALRITHSRPSTVHAPRCCESNASHRIIEDVFITPLPQSRRPLKIFAESTAIVQEAFAQLRAVARLVEPTNKGKADRVGGKIIEYAIVFILSVAASILGWKIIQWWRRRGDDSDDDWVDRVKAKHLSRMAYERSAKKPEASSEADQIIPHAVRAANPDEVTLVKRRSSELMQPQVARALREGYAELEWGTLLARIVDARFEGNYEKRTSEVEKLLQRNFGLDLDALLARAPRRTWIFVNNRFEPDGRISTYVRGIMEFFGVHPRREFISGFDIVRIMSRRTAGGLGFRSGDALQIALLWVLKETGVALGERASREMSDDFIRLADTFRGEIYVERAAGGQLNELMSRVNYQLRNGCRYVHEHAMVAHLARYLHDRWQDDQFATMGGRMLVGNDHLSLAREIESLDFEGVVSEGNDAERYYVVSLQRILTARLKYLAATEGKMTAEDPRTILECAREHAIDAFQRAVATGRALKAYRAYIKDVRMQIGIALDSFHTPGDGGAHGDDEGKDGSDGSPPHGAADDRINSAADGTSPMVRNMLPPVWMLRPMRRLQLR